MQSESAHSESTADGGNEKEEDKDGLASRCDTATAASAGVASRNSATLVGGAEDSSSDGEEAESLDYIQPTDTEVHEQVAALFNSKSGVLRTRPFNATKWDACFAPFGPSLPYVLTERLSSSALAHSECKDQVEA